MDRTVEQHRPVLTGVAFRLLGSAHDAEDMVQEAYSRWYGLAPTDRAGIETPAAWLVRVTSRICLDYLRSARVRRENYVGEWLPEPLPVWHPATTGARQSDTADPADEVTLDESVSTAVMVLLEDLSPAERVSFVLHDVFGVSFSEIGTIVGRTPAACRQLAVSARRHARSARSTQHASPTTHRAAVAAFRRACSSGDLQQLLTTLAPDVVTRVDGGGKTRAARRPLHGSDKVARFLLGVFHKQPTTDLIECDVNGHPGVVIRAGDRVVGVCSFEVINTKIKTIWYVANPDKLNLWSAQ